MNNFKNIKKACFTGYRPDKFDFKLNTNNVRYLQLRKRLTTTLTDLIENGCNIFYCGMAIGFDIVCGECVVKLKRKYKNIHLIAAVPFLGQQDGFGEEWQKRYNRVISASNEVVYLLDEYHVSAYHIRNKYMVDNSDCVICWYDGRKGGTHNTVTYAQKCNKYLININTEYNEELNSSQFELDL